MGLENGTTRSLASVFAAYTDDHEFDRSVPRTELVTLDGEFISRSEAKRFVLGLEEFRRVDLDFTGVEMIGRVRRADGAADTGVGKIR